MASSKVLADAIKKNASELSTIGFVRDKPSTFEAVKVTSPSISTPVPSSSPSPIVACKSPMARRPPS